MSLYRCHYVRHPIYVGLGSRLVVQQYQRGGRWPESARVWEPDYGLPAAPPQLFTVNRLPTTHVVVREVEADSIELVASLMQADGWSDAEIRAWNQHIEGLGLTHASMSAGDVVEDVAASTFHEVELFGWRELIRE